MSFLDAIKQDALATFNAVANALHAQFANTLSQAGHAVTPSDTVDTLVTTASSAAANAPTEAHAAVANNALATFTTGLTAAALQFAQAHLPAKFQSSASAAIQTAGNVAAAVASGSTLDAQSIATDLTRVAAGAVAAAVPGVAPIVSAVEPLVESVESALTSSAPAANVAAAVEQAAAPAVTAAVQTGAAAVESTLAAEVDKVAPGAGASLVSAGVAAIEQAAGVGTASPDQTPAANPNGV